MLVQFYLLFFILFIGLYSHVCACVHAPYLAKTSSKVVNTYMVMPLCMPRVRPIAPML